MRKSEAKGRKERKALHTNKSVPLLKAENSNCYESDFNKNNSRNLFKNKAKERETDTLSARSGSDSRLILKEGFRAEKGQVNKKEEFRIFLSYRGTTSGQEFVSDLHSYLVDDPLSEELYGQIYYSPKVQVLGDFKSCLPELMKSVKFFILPLTKGFFDGFPDPSIENDPKKDTSITYREILYAMENDVRFIVIPLDDYDKNEEREEEILRGLYGEHADRITTIKRVDNLLWAANREKEERDGKADPAFSRKKSELFVQLSKELIRPSNELGSIGQKIDQQQSNVLLDFKSSLEDSSTYPFFQRIYDVKRMYLLNFASSSFISGIDVAKTYDDHNTLKSWFSHSLATGQVELTIILTDPYSHAARDAAVFKMFPEFPKISSYDIIPGNLNKLIQFKRNNPAANLKIYLTKIALPYGIMLTENQNAENSHMKVDLYAPVIVHDGKRPSFYMKQKDESTKEIYRFFKDNILSIMTHSYEYRDHPDTSWLVQDHHEFIHKAILHTALPHTEKGVQNCIENGSPMEIDLLMLEDGQKTMICGRQEEWIKHPDRGNIELKDAMIMDIEESAAIVSPDLEIGNGCLDGNKKLTLKNLLDLVNGKVPLILEIKTSLSSLNDKISEEEIDRILLDDQLCKNLEGAEVDPSYTEDQRNELLNYISHTRAQVKEVLQLVDQYLLRYGEIFSEKYNCSGHGVAIHSSDWHVLKLVRKLNCMIPCGIISTDFSAFLTNYGFKPNPDFLSFHSNAKRMIELKPDFISYDIHHLDNGIAIEVKKAAHIPLLAWTIRSDKKGAERYDEIDWLKKKARSYQCDNWVIEKPET